MKPLIGLSLMHEDEFLQAALPLFIEEKVDVVEWSFDTIKTEKAKPQWLHQILTEYSNNKRLIGHGVRYSLFDAKWTKKQSAWLNKLSKELNRYSYSHITEHFGFMSSNDFHKGAPLPVSLNKSTLQLGQNRLKVLQQVCKNIPIGVENLAFAFSLEDVKQHAEFLGNLIKPINGFIILDLHNVYCQSENFKVDFFELINTYPLHKVREIHISGGSWQKSIYSKSIKKVRRDTHDDTVPQAIFDILPKVISLCPNLQYVIFERIGSSLKGKNNQDQFRKDYLKLRSIIDELNFKPKPNTFKKKSVKISTAPINNLELYKEQQFISKTLANSVNPEITLNILSEKQLKFWDLSKWNISMLETAIQIANKWS